MAKHFSDRGTIVVSSVVLFIAWMNQAYKETMGAHVLCSEEQPLSANEVNHKKIFPQTFANIPVPTIFVSFKTFCYFLI